MKKSGPQPKNGWRQPAKTKRPSPDRVLKLMGKKNKMRFNITDLMESMEKGKD